MMQLITMTKQAFADYLPLAISQFAEEKVLAGNWTANESVQLSQETFANLLPNDENTKDHHLFSIQQDLLLVGMIWLHQSSTTASFIYDFIIFDEFQRKGYGEQAMKLLEIEARKLGIEEIGLHVFGHNNGAIKLYNKLGYITTNISMTKKI
ncbi:GNAT family N-acetyltransferase [Kurthia sibirica]|uniref:GNAT family N-acetyltransferase n=2 Tax=Kurthia sibirica TaxID=202750 RepID=A0A2U3AKR5_9BACL|nr:GNAT family N-acetyltransferase [Kurthia sibirica]